MKLPATPRLSGPWLATLAATMAAAAFVSIKVRQAEKQHPPKGQFIEVDGVRLHFVERGLGRPVVFLHGLGSMSEDFALSGVLERCAAEHRVIAFDRPGYGYSERPRLRTWTPEAQARLLHATLKRMGIDKPILVGHSWGTLVAASMALQFPESVHSLVLLSGYYYPTARVDAPLMAAPAIPVLGDLWRATAGPLLGRLMWPGLRKLLFSPAAVTDGFREYPAWLSLRPRALRAGASESALLIPAAFRMSSHYSELQVPTFIVAGDADRYVSTETHSVRLHHEVPGSVLQLVAGAGHMIQHIAPDEVLRVIGEAARSGKAATPALSTA